jgi:hypothetical protein
MELNLENIAHHGTRTLHIPILILSGCLCLITLALLLRFLYLNNPSRSAKDGKFHSPQKAEYRPMSIPKMNIMHKIISDSILTPKFSRRKKEVIYIECPQCNQHYGLISNQKRLEFPCPFCGIEGFMELR